MRSRKILLPATLGFGLAASLAAAPVSTAAPSAADRAPVSAYTGSSADRANTKAFFEAVIKSAKAKQAETGAAAVTVTYDASQAPSFASEIASSTQIWNSSVDNVKLQEGSGADFEYREGNDPRGSYASTDGHGNGYIFLDYAQNEQYDSTRVTAHETGHVLGLPDHYEGPCSELMSGGGPGPSCTNAQPNADEIGRVNSLWANGIVGPFDKAAYLK
ncbi:MULTISPECIES: snapalysin [Streptomyces]|uniref:Extracellular small neutral protease n=1 Tax=Streptomyces lycii TaxID=2654337 RepID=A0ABQ7FIR3_9ACTN|nr:MULTISPECIES: snapalysin [Streptomyces]KAF4407848.1 snapalysin [Streptomyces lycii]PGH47425.1 ABC transporter substrate-binding protein [Streptomyces sp. Ru87]